MSIVWGSWSYAGGNGVRIGIDLSYSGTTITAKYYLDGEYNFSGDVCSISYSGAYAGSADTYTFNFSTGGSPVLAETHTVAGTANSTYTFAASGSGFYNGSTPSVSGVSITLPPAVPAAPTGVGATRVSDTQQTVAWTTNATSSAPYASQQVRRAVVDITGATGPFSTIATVSGSATSYSDTTTIANRVYRYQIAAVNATGTTYSAISSWVHTTPAAPSSVSASVDSAGDVVISWTVNAQDRSTRTVIEESTDGGTTYSALATTSSATTNSYTETSPAATTHTYRAHALVSGTSTDPGYGLTSSSVVSNTIALASAPSAPTGLAPNGSTVDLANAQTLTWTYNPTDSSPQSNFEVQHRLLGGSTWTTTGETASTTSSWTLPAGTYANGQTIEWQVRTWGQLTASGDASPWSASATIIGSSTPTATISSAGSTTVTRTNLYPRPTFAAGWTGYYDYAGTGGVTSDTVVTGGGYVSGEDCLRVTWTTASTSSGGVRTLQTDETLTAGASYTISAWVKPSVDVTFSNQAWFYKDGTAIGAAGGSFPTRTAPAGVWTRLQMRVDVPADGTVNQVQPRWYASGAPFVVGATLDFSAPLMEEGSTLAAYFDGDMTSADGVTYSWTGTVGDSSSTAVTNLVATSSAPLDWTFFQAEGGSQAAWRITVTDLTTGTSTVYSGTGTTGTYTVTGYADGNAYSVALAVESDAGLWSADASVSVAVSYLPPADIDVTATFSDLDGSVTLTLAPQAWDGTTTLAQTGAYIQRSDDGTTWTTLNATALDPAASAIDMTAPVNGTSQYRIIAESSLPSTATGTAATVTGSTTKWCYLSQGAGYANVVRFYGAPSVKSGAQVDQALYQFAGRTLPVAYFGSQITSTLAVSGILTDDSSTPADLRAIAKLAGPWLWRDPSGRAFYGSLTGMSVDESAPNVVFPVSFAMTEVDTSG